MDNRMLTSPTIEWVSNPNGVARVPTVGTSGNIILHTYDRFTKEYVVFSYDSNTGKQLWSTYLPAGGYASPTIGEGVVFLPCGYTQICGLDENTGEKLWIKELHSRNRSTPTFYQGVAYLGVGNKIYGLKPDGTLEKEGVFPGNLFYGNPLIINDTLYILGDSNPTKNKSMLYIFAIDLITMRLNWKMEIGSAAMISCDSSGLAFHDSGCILVGGFDGYLKCIDIKSKSIKWETKGDGILTRSKPFVYKDTVYINSLSGYIMAVDVLTGKIKFNQFLSSEGMWCPPIVYDNYLWVHSGVFLYVLNKDTGEIVNKIAIGHSPYTNFAIASGKLYIAAGDPPDSSYLYCLRLSNNPRLFIKETKIDYKYNSNNEESFDDIEIVFSVGTADGINPENLKVDLSIFGNSSSYEPEPLKAKEYKITTKIPKFNRYGDYALLVEARVGNGIYKTTLPVCLREYIPDDLPKTYQLKNFTIDMQEQDHYSGAAVMKSVMDFYGKKQTQEAINKMGEYLDDLGIHGHHKWRTGAVRMLHSSSDIRNIKEEEILNKVNFKL